MKGKENHRTLRSRKFILNTLKKLLGLLLISVLYISNMKYCMGRGNYQRPNFMEKIIGFVKCGKFGRGKSCRKTRVITQHANFN